VRLKIPRTAHAALCSKEREEEWGC